MRANMCGGLKERAVDSYTRILSHQLVELLRIIRKYGLVWVNVSLGVSFEVS